MGRIKAVALTAGSSPFLSFLRFQPHYKDTSCSQVYCHNSMVFQDHCQQASCSSVSTNHTQMLCSQTPYLKVSEFTLTGWPRNLALKNATAFFLLLLKTKKHTVSFLSTPSKCFVAGPLKRAAKFYS